MEKIKCPSKTKLIKENERCKKGEVKVRDKKNGKEARVTLQLNIPGTPNPRITKYGATEAIARQRLAEAVVLTYIGIQKNKQFANIQVFSPECQTELEKFDEYMACIKKYQLKANGEKKEIKEQVEHPISLYVERMIKTRKKLSEQKGIRKKRKISKKTVASYWHTAKKQVLPYFRR